MGGIGDGRKGTYQERTYRDIFKGINLIFFDVCLYETDLRIGAVKNLYSEALELVKLYRGQIVSYIEKHSDFLTSLIPIDPQPEAPYIVKRMCEAAKMAGVGPMAAVAGAVSELVGQGLLRYSDEVIVENGGDIYVKANILRKVGIYAGNSPLSGKVAIEVLPDRTPAGICTSSGTVGHSLSFGIADAATIVSKDVFLSDAVATATGNIVKSPSDVEKALEFASNIKGVEGALIIIGDKLGAWGDIKLSAC